MSVQPVGKGLTRSASIPKLWDAIGTRKPFFILTLFVWFLDTLVDSLGLSWSIRSVSNAALSRDLDAVYRSVLLLVVVVVGRAAFLSLGTYMTTRVSEDMALNLRTRLFSAVMGGKSEYFDAHESGDLISRLTNDVETAKRGINAFVNGIRQIFLIALALTGLIVWSWPFAVGLLIMASISFLGGASTSGSLRKTGQQYQETLAGVSESATNLFGGVAVIKSLRAEKEMEARFGAVTDEHRQVAKRRGFYVAIQSGTVMSIPFLGLAGMMILAGSMALRGLFSPGDSIGLVQLSSRALFPFSSLGGIWADLQQNLAALDRVLDACALPQEDGELRGSGKSEAPSQASLGDVPAVEFREVHFRYGSKPVLDGISFRVRRSDKAALVGPSGSGKSTILRLILRMYEAASGTILLDGQDTASMPISVLRSMIAVVPQDPWMIPGTVKDNILLGRADATDEEIASAASMANAAEFVEALPDKYDTVLDERGGNLSGGQRQRICLARAFLKNAPLLLLDEPTSAVDAESERLIRQAVDLLARGRTVLTVAHTQAMVESADVTIAL